MKMFVGFCMFAFIAFVSVPLFLFLVGAFETIATMLK